MKKRQRGKTQFSHKAIANKVGVSRQRLTVMINNPSQGANRQRLMAALIDMGLTKEAAERFIHPG